MEETSVLASRSIYSSTCEVSDGDPTTEQHEVTSSFLTLVGLLLSEISTLLYSDPRPLYWLETAGEGLSFTVKKSAKTEPSAEVIAYKVSRITFSERETSVSTKEVEARKFRDLMMELHILAHAPLRDHENIVKLLGFMWTPNPYNDTGLSPVLRVEFAPHGTLADFQNSGRSLDTAGKFQLCYDIANGLKALHECGIVHGDVKSENVLVFDHERGYIAKLCDFGCAVITTPTSQGTVDPLCRLPGGTIPWRAPEASEAIYRSKLHLTDVYSFGLLIWKVLMDGRDPFASLDLPSDKEARYNRIRWFLSIDPNALVSIIICSIEMACGEFQANGTFDLLILFRSTISADPDQRDLDSAFEVLKNYCSRESYRSPPPATMQKIRRLDLTLKKVTVNHWLLAQWSTITQELFIAALKNIESITREILESSDAVNTYIEDLQAQSLWCLFQCYILGIGCEADPDRALDHLSKIIQTRGNTPIWFRALAILAPLHEALNIQPQESLQALTVRCGWAAAVRGSQPALKWIGSYLDSTDTQQRFSQERAESLAYTHDINQEEVKKGHEELRRHLTTTNNQQRFVVRGAKIGGENSLLHVAALFDDLDTVKVLVKKCQVDVNVLNKRGQTPLLIACRQENFAVAKYLLDGGADASIGSLDRETPLHWLSSFDSHKIPEIATSICSNGGKTTFDSMAGPYAEDGLIPKSYIADFYVPGNPLERAVGRNCFEAVRILLELYELPESVGWSGKLERSIVLAASLHLATVLLWLLIKIFEVDVEEGRCLKKKELGLHWRSRGGSSLIRWAIPATFECERLCLHGNQRDQAMKETFEVLQDFGFIDSTLYIGASTRATLQYAIPLARDAVVEYLLTETACGEGVNTPDPGSGFTPIHEAIRYGKKAAFRSLLQHGANIDLRGRYEAGDALRSVEANYLSVCASCRTNDTFFANEIIRAGVPANLPDSRGVTPLSLAIFRRAFRLANFLLNHGANVNTISKEGFTMLGTILQDTYINNYENPLESIKFIVNITSPHEAPSFIVNPEKRLTILHMASACRDRGLHSSELMGFLLSRYREKDQIDAKAATTATALQFAIGAQNLPAVKALLEAGADIDILGPKGTTTLQLAKDFVPKTSLAELYLPASGRTVAGSNRRRGLEIVALIESAKEWSDESKIRSIILPLYRELLPYLQQLESISHEESKQLGIQGIVCEIVGRHTAVDDHSSWGLEKIQQQINGIIQPWFYSEILFQFYSAPFEFPPTKVTLQKIRRITPWLEKLNDIQLLELQQAAKFEFILDQLYQMERDNEPLLATYSTSMFTSYATSGKLEDLPTTTRNI